MLLERRSAAAVVVLLAIGTAVLARNASLRQSATFDEIVLASAGARGVVHGRWDMVLDQPPIMTWLYGRALAEVGPALPDEGRAWTFDDRWEYARQLFFERGNDPEHLIARVRAVTSGMAGLVVLAAGAFAWWMAGPGAGVLSAAFTAFVPDVLAHGGIAYNDVPLALAFLLAVWALDAAVRRPTVGRGVLAGAALAAAFGMKMSALALAPVAILLVVAEVVSSPADRGERGRWTALATTAGVTLLAFYLGLVLLYRGDPFLTVFRFNVWRTVLHATGGHPGDAFLLGRSSSSGWWYYFPVAALFKTPVAFQAALVGASALLVRRWVGSGRSPRALAAWRGRSALLGVVVFGAFLLRSDLNVGFRYALPVLPLLAALAAVGWAGGAKRGRTSSVVLVLLLASHAVSTLSVHPHYLSFSSLWVGGRDRAWRVLSDSNVDWGQGLLELRDFMREEGVASVRLSYFGSARPEAYGVEYVALPSFFRLVPERTPGAEESPRFTVISATNLHGLYFGGLDPLAAYRDREPYRVLGHALFVYDEG